MQSSQNITDRLERDHAEAWRPDEGDTLTGKVVEISQREGAYGVCPIVTVEQDSGKELAFHAFHSVAQNELAKARPQIGEIIAIKYIGQRASEDHRKRFHLYRVAVDRPVQAFNWRPYSARRALARTRDRSACGAVRPWKRSGSAWKQRAATDGNRHSNRFGGAAGKARHRAVGGNALVILAKYVEKLMGPRIP